MPQYVAPNTDVSRLAFMSRAIKTAEAMPPNATQHIPAPLLAELTAHYQAYRAAYEAAQAALSRRKTETAESAAAMARLQMYLSHLWQAVANRVQRENLPVGALGYYKLTNDGHRPTFSRREEWLEVATSVVAGDAQAVLAGLHPCGRQLPSAKPSCKTAVRWPSPAAPCRSRNTIVCPLGLKRPMTPPHARARRPFVARPIPQPRRKRRSQSFASRGETGGRHLCPRKTEFVACQPTAAPCRPLAVTIVSHRGSGEVLDEGMSRPWGGRPT